MMNTKIIPYINLIKSHADFSEIADFIEIRNNRGVLTKQYITGTIDACFAFNNKLEVILALTTINDLLEK